MDNKQFKALANVENGEVNTETVFHYRQKEDVIWATYEGGAIRFGTICGLIQNDRMEFTYQHINHEGMTKTGKCFTIIKTVENKIQLHETWQWTCDDFSTGTSVLEEI